jgi:hypothetical protein
MERTRVYFMFGNHGSMAIRPDPAFFTREVCKVLKEEIISNGKNATIIHEAVPCPGYTRKRDFGRFVRASCKDRDSAKARLRGQISDARAKLEEMLAHLDCGRLTLEMDDGDLGFEKAVAYINRKEPGRIRNLAEPWTQRSTLLTICSEFHDLFHASPFGAQKLDLVVEMLAFAAGSAYERDLGVLRLVRKLAEAEPGRIIIIPRGTHHRMMGRHAYTQLDEGAIEARTCCEIGWETGFHFENMIEMVLSELYQNKLGMDDLMHYSTFTLLCQLQAERLQKERRMDLATAGMDALIALEAEAIVDTYAIVSHAIAP